MDNGIVFRLEWNDNNRFPDRSGWPRLAQAEADGVYWIDSPTNLDCMIIRSPQVSWCGYVAVPPLHPWYKRPYQDIEHLVTIHGGLTFSDMMYQRCPLVDFGDRWWFGFDTSHAGDYFYTPISGGNAGVYRTASYVSDQVCTLAAQCVSISRDTKHIFTRIGV